MCIKPPKYVSFLVPTFYFCISPLLKHVLQKKGQETLHLMVGVCTTEMYTYWWGGGNSTMAQWSGFTQ